MSKVMQLVAVLAFSLTLSGSLNAQQVENSVPCSEGNEPALLMYGDHTSGCAIDNVTDLDRFVFSGVKGDSVRINVFAGPALDPRLEVLDPTGESISNQACNTGFSTACAFITSLELEQTGQYTLLLSDAQTDNSGSYTLQLERIPPAIEPPDIVVDDPQGGSISPVTDTDFFTYEGVAASRVRVLVFSPPALDPRLRVWDPAGVQIVNTFCNTGFSTACSYTLDLDLESSGTYLFAISDAQLDNTGSYNLEVQCLFGTCPTVRAEFEADVTSGPSPLTVTFSDASVGVTADTWFWDFGDGNTSTQQNPTHTYQSGGSFDVSLSVSGPEGADVVAKTGFITVVEGPVAGFVADPESGVAPLEVAFVNTTTGTYDSCSWDFGDGGASTECDPTHTYTTPGTYSVTLTVDGLGGQGMVTRTDLITVETPQVDFVATPTTGLEPLVVNFTDTSSGQFDTWAWNFGDGNMSTQQNPSHTYLLEGTYSVSLTVSGASGTLMETKADLIRVVPGVEVEPGEKVLGALAEGETHRVVFEAAEGSGLTLVCSRSKKAAKQTGAEFVKEFEPELKLFDPLGEQIGIEQSKDGKAFAIRFKKKEPLEVTGLYLVEITSQTGTGGTYQLRSRLTPNRRIKFGPTPVGDDDSSTTLPIPAVSDTTIQRMLVKNMRPKGKFKTTPGGKAVNLEPVLTIESPIGEEVLEATAPNAKKDTIILVEGLVLPDVGVYDAIIDPVGNTAGFVRGTVKLKFPRNKEIIVFETPPTEEP